MSRAHLVFVHAHPDDETINNGLTMASYAAAGHRVTLVTCTRGEEGEVLVPEFAHLAADRDDTLGSHREGELAAAMAELGVTDHRFLDRIPLEGRQGHYRDSGMSYAPDGAATWAVNPRAEAFALAPVESAAARLAGLLREVRPQVVVTYEPGGGYGHPDHVQTHRVTMRAVELAAQGPAAWVVPKVYWCVIPEQGIRSMIELIAAAAPGEQVLSGWGVDSPLPSMVVPDELVTTAVRAPEFISAKAAALRAHATQVSLESPVYRMSVGGPASFAGVEFYQLVTEASAAGLGGPLDADGRESDLLGGLNVAGSH